MESLCACLFGKCLLLRRGRGFLMNSQACCGGMLFGMDSGIIGGVLTMTPFEQ